MTLTGQQPGQARQPSKLALRGDLLDFAADPQASTDQPGDHGSQDAVRFTPDGWLLIEDGRIVGVESASFQPEANWQILDRQGYLICPGFVDTHVHSGQLDVIASYGATLLQWLDQYTFPNERRFADFEFARQEADVFCQALLANGTTTAAVFPTVHAHSVETLFNAAQKRGMCLIAGKVLMNRHCPEDLMDGVDLGEAESRSLIKRWHETDRLHYAITPRFAPTSTDEQLALGGRLVREFETLYVQTHVAENSDEMAWVADLFKQDRSYLSVYHRHGLLTKRSLLAHGIWLDTADRALLGDMGASIAFCPSSNMFLGSGLLNVHDSQGGGAQIVLASDVGGGTHLSMLRVMADAGRVMALTGQKLTAFRAFYMATLGAAKALHLASSIGSFSAGAHADLVVLRWSADDIATRRQARASLLHERLYALMVLGDKTSVRDTFVNGRQV